MRPIVYVSDIMRIAAALADENDHGDLPVDDWHPAHCGQMDLVIKADGTWVHEGAIISRPALVRLFSRVLRKDADEFVLVTPAEKITIQVEDAPFIAVDVNRIGEDLQFQTNVGDRVTAGPNHPLTVVQTARGEGIPYIVVRGGLLAKCSRACFYRLVEMADIDGSNVLSVRSGGEKFVLGDGQ